jgi:hypothetical protein
MGDFLQSILAEIRVRRSLDTLLFSQTNGIFRRIGGMQCLHFNEDEHIPVPGDEIDFSGSSPISRCHHAKTVRAKMRSSLDFGLAAERKDLPPPVEKRHGLGRRGGNAFGKNADRALRLFFVDQERR